MTDEEYIDLAEQVKHSKGKEKADIEYRLYDEAFIRMERLGLNDFIPLQCKKVDKVTASLVIGLIEQGWILNAPLGMPHHYEGVSVERTCAKKGLIKFDGEWHNLADLLSVGYGVVPF